MHRLRLNQDKTMSLYTAVYEANPLVPLHAVDTIENPLICIPGAGASVTAFVEFVNALGEKWPIYGLQPRGIDIAEQSHKSVEEAAIYNLRAIRRLGLTRPVHLLGHSHGGLVAFDIALRLHQQGRRVASLTLIDTEPPDSIEETPYEMSTAEIFREFVEVFEDTFDVSLQFDRAVMALEHAQSFINCLHAALIKARVLPNRNNDVTMLRGSLATFTAARRCRYVPAGCYANKLYLVLVNSRCNQHLNMDNERKRQETCAAKWRRHAAEIDVWYGPGHHFSILQSPHVSLLAKWWRQARAL